MLKGMLDGNEEKLQVWQAMNESDAGEITFEEFKARVITSVYPLGVSSIAVRQELSHNGLCIRGGMAEKFLTRLNIID